MHHGFLVDVGIAVIAATLFGILAQRLKQPIILGYLIAGIIIGPMFGSPLVSDPESISVISEIGLILLLFIIGLEMNPKSLMSSGKQIAAAGGGQFPLAVLLGVGFFLMLGYSLDLIALDALYLAIFCGLSSTTIVVKILSDKFELDTITGRLTLGVLIFQDIWAILVLAIQPNFTDPDLLKIGAAIAKSVVLFGGGFMLSKYILRRVFEWNARSPEMVVAISIGWAAMVAAAADMMGLSKEMGALIAGVSISTFPYSIHVTAKVLPLRDFFLTLFFVSLGMQIPAPELGMLLPVIVIVLFTIASRFATVYPLLTLSGSSPRTGFITSLNLAQISEFSLVIAALGLTFGHIGKETMSLILYAMSITSIASSYFIKYNHEIFMWFDRWLMKSGRRTSIEDDAAGEAGSHDIVLLGYHRGAMALVETMVAQRPDLIKHLLVVDYNLEVLKDLQTQHIHGVFGDISSADTLTHAHIERAKIILSTIPDVLLRGTTNLKLIKMCRTLAPHAMIIATADLASQVAELKSVGANEVIMPYAFAGEHLAQHVIALSEGLVPTSVDGPALALE